MVDVKGRIERVWAEAGIQSRLLFTVILSHSSKDVLNVCSANISTHFSYSANGRAEDDAGSGHYLGQAYFRDSLSVVVNGGGNSATICLDLRPETLEEIESHRAGRDLFFRLLVRLVGMERSEGNSLALNIAVEDATRHSYQYLSIEIARSKWEELLQELDFSTIQKRRQVALQLEDRVSKALEKAEKAEEIADRAEGKARGSANLTAVSQLSGAYDEEAKKCARSATFWGAAAALTALLGGFMIAFFLWEGFKRQLHVEDAVLRGVAIASIIAVFNLVMRIYEAYRHLEVVNRHRVNVGRSFEAMKEAQPSDRAKDVMAAITAEHLLAFGKSGFIPGDKSVQTPLTSFSELLKSVLDRPDKG